MAYNYPSLLNQNTIDATRSKAIGAAVPNASRLAPRANQIIDSMLSGDVSPSASIRDAAYFGVGSGMPGSEVAQKFGYDLYGQRREARQQQGIQDLLQFLSQDRQDQSLALSAAGQASDDAARNRQQSFEEQRWGKNRVYRSDKSGQTFDRLGQPMGYQGRFDWSNPMN